jgi:uncharacterized protein (DUF4415 family)
MNNSPISNKLQSDLERLDALTDEEIDLSDTPEITPEMFAKAIVRRGLTPPPSKQQVTLRIDSDVLDWFREQGRGYQTQINTLLRAYMEAHQHQQIN